MCGLAGLVRVLDEDAVRRSLDALAHRGPDDHGIFVDPRGVVLGHRRLAVVDLTPTGHQPMLSDDGRVAIVFNGEIYDHDRLREELGISGFRGTSDTEVLLRGYERFGLDELLARIDGMFAFAIWDGRRSELHLARDRFGKKPLYLARRGAGLAFASTLPAVLELLETRPPLRDDALVALLTLTYVPGSSSMFDGIERLPPGTRLTVRADGSQERATFFEPRLGPFVARDPEELDAALEASLEAAVRRRRIADVPLGAFLSGGIDSSLVVAMMARGPGRVRTIAMGFEGSALDERPYARAVADAFDTDHTELVLPTEALSVLPHLVYTTGEPLADHALLPTYLLAREAKRHLTVVLTGDGGDELFGGYEDYRIVALARMLPALASMPQTDLGGTIGRRLSRLAAYARLGHVVDPLGTRGFRGRLGRWLAPEFAARTRNADPDRDHREAARRLAALGAVDRAMGVDLATLLPDDFLHKLDAATMAHGVEARSPFLDRRLFELARSIPWTTKLRGGRTKAPLRRLASRLLPASVAKRGKHGFSPPTGRWLRQGTSAETVRRLLLAPGGLDGRFMRPEAVRGLLDAHRAGDDAEGQRLHTLVVADVFLRLFLDRSLRPDDDLHAFARDLPGS